jgi:hypothetical protein
MTQDLLVATRGGLGDHIISNGLIHHLTSETYNFRKVNLVCYKRWENSLRYLYEDNPRVILHPGKQDDFLGIHHEKQLTKMAEENGWKYYSIATFAEINLRKYQEFFYAAVNHPFEYRYTKFQLPKREPINEEFLNIYKPKKPYTLGFFHDKFTNGTIRGAQYDKLNPDLELIEIQPGKTTNLFDWLPIIYDAEEIHTIPGGPFHLIDSVLDKCKAKKFVYHDARRETCFDPNNKFNNKCWKIVRYAIKHAM